MNPFRVALAVARKDLRSEWRTREMVPALAQFVVLALLIGNFGFQIDSRNALTIAPGILWMALVDWLRSVAPSPPSVSRLRSMRC